MEGAVHVQHVVGEPAQSEQAHEHQHDLRQTLPGLHLKKGCDGGVGGRKGEGEVDLGGEGNGGIGGGE